MGPQINRIDVNNGCDIHRNTRRINGYCLTQFLRFDYLVFYTEIKDTTEFSGRYLRNFSFCFAFLTKRKISEGKMI